MIIFLIVVVLIGMGLGGIGAIGQAVSNANDKNQNPDKKKETMLENCEKICELLRHRKNLVDSLGEAQKGNDWTRESLDNIEGIQKSIKELDDKELNNRINRVTIWTAKN